MSQLSLAAIAGRTPAPVDLKCLVLLAAAVGLAPAPAAAAESIDIAVGHQSMCTDTYTGGIVIKELKLLEKHLPHTSDTPAPATTSPGRITPPADPSPIRCSPASSISA